MFRFITEGEGGEMLTATEKCVGGSSPPNFFSPVCNLRNRKEHGFFFKVPTNSKEH